VEDSFDIVGGGPRTGASPTRVIDSSERSREQEGDSQGTSRLGTRHPVTTSNDYPTYYTQAGRQSGPDNKSNPSQVLGIQSNILFGILPGHASVTDAVTRLQRERDLALRRIDELHEHYKKELKSKDDADHRMAQ